MTAEHDDLAGLSADLHDLSTEVQGVGQKLDDHREAYITERAASERRIAESRRKARRATFAGVAGTVAALIAVGVAGWAVYLVKQANAERAQRTITACEQAAEKAQKDNAQDDVFIDLLTDITGGTENPATVEFLSPYIDRLNDNRSPVRDCSPEGIEAYYSSGGTQGYLP